MGPELADVVWRGWADDRSAGAPWLGSLREVTAFDEARVLVVAPHMDDEVIGCGATMVRHVEAGAKVTTVFLTDGSRSHPDADPDELRAARKLEARAAARLMGGVDTVFVDGPDTALRADDETITALAEVVADVAPTGVYVPWIFDTHRDHHVANLVLASALDACAGRVEEPAWIRAYEVWTPTVANVVVDISDRVRRKAELVRTYRSQFVSEAPDLVLGLARYRSLSLDWGTHAEAFTELGPDDYRRLVAAVNRHR